MEKHLKISVIILAKNEEERIQKCLASLSWCNERIVIDNGSDDGTAFGARKNKAVVYEVRDRSFASLRNFGKEKAKYPWILYIDADEIVPSALAEEIARIVENDDIAISAYQIRRKTFYLGYPWPVCDNQVRLFRKNNLTEWYGPLHESAKVNGAIGLLQEPLYHDTHRSLEEMVTKTNQWSETEAKLRFDARHPPVVAWRLFRVMISSFSDSYIRQKGWRAGTIGLIESIYQSFSMFITYAKLWEMQEKSNI